MPRMPAFARAGALAIGSIASLMLLAPGAAQAQDKVDGPKVSWQLSVWGNPRAFTKGIEYVASEVEKRTGGNFTIKIGYGGTLSPERENLDGIKIGAFEMAAICTAYHPGKTPASLAPDLPFMPLSNPDVAIAIYEAVYQHPAIIAEMKQWDAQILMAGLLPQYEFMGVGDPPTTVEAWKGRRVRALGGLGDAMRLIGANTATPPASEVYTALDRKTVDAASFPFSYAHASYKLHEISKWFTTNMSPSTTNCPTVVSITAWNKLPPQYQKLLTELRLGAYEELKKAYKEADDKNIPDFKARGLVPITYSAEELAKFRAVGGKPVWDKWVVDHKDKFPAEELIKLILDTAKKAGAS